MTLTLLKPGELRPATETLKDGAYIVGRGKAAKIALPYADVSERHALIMVRGGKASIEDLKSANGTYVNGQQIDGPTTSITAIEALDAKWTAFGWNVIIADGHDFEAILAAFEQAKANVATERPTMILFKTEMGHGIDFMAGTHKWHGKAPKPEEVEAALKQLPETLGDY
jgi:hypothetical protein